jgi:signal transduction histidine kinase
VRAVIQFSVTGMLAVLLLGVIAVTLLRHTGTTEAIRSSKQLTQLAGDGVVAPYITPALLRRDPAAIARLDAVVRARVLHDPVVRVKVWDASGMIIYSDLHRLIGSRYPLGAAEQMALRSGKADAEVSDLARPENRFERSQKKLLEVYLGIRSTNGKPLLYEEYQRFSSISASGQRLWKRFLPALVGALVLLELAQIPLAVSLARRLQRGQRDREALLRNAVEASDRERRRIASDLHDGVVQSLAGASYNLAAAAGELAPGSRPREAVERGAEQTRRTVRELRSLLVDIYPPTLRRAGLETALSDLLTGVEGDGVEARLTVDPGIELAPETEALLFRAAQEAVRNARAHAQASTLDVSVHAHDGTVVLEVADDGRGFAVPDPGEASNGHFGLRILADLARDAGARFDIVSAPGEGTRVVLETSAG